MSLGVPPPSSDGIASHERPATERSQTRQGAKAWSTPRLLRVEYRGQVYDWFDLDELGDVVRAADVAGTLRENISHYFDVPRACQIVCDCEGVLASAADFARALRPGSSEGARLIVHDVRDLAMEFRERTAQQLQDIATEIAQLQHTLRVITQSADTSGGGDGVERASGDSETPAAATPLHASQMTRADLVDEISRAKEALAFPAAIRAAAVAPTAATVPAFGGYPEVSVTAPDRTPETSPVATAVCASGPATARQGPCPPVSQASRLGGPGAATRGAGLLQHRDNRSYRAPDGRLGNGSPARLRPMSTGGVGAESGRHAGFRTPNRSTNSTPRLATCPSAAPTALSGSHSCPAARASSSARCRSPTPTGGIGGGAGGAGGAGAGQAAVGPRLAPFPPPLTALSSQAPGAPAALAALPTAWHTTPGSGPGAPRPPSTAGIGGAAPGPGPLCTWQPVHGSAIRSAQSPERRSLSFKSATAPREPSPQPPQFAQMAAQATLAGGYEEAFQSVEVVLSKEPGGGARGPGQQRFGFANVPTRDGRGLIVSWVDEVGLLYRWNRAHPDKAVHEGDRIVAVNSASDEVEAMRAQLQVDTVRMLVHRRNTSSC